MKKMIVASIFVCLFALINMPKEQESPEVCWSFLDWLWGTETAEDGDGYDYQVEYRNPQGQVVRTWRQHTPHRASVSHFRDGYSQLSWRTNNYGDSQVYVSDKGYTFSLREIKQ